MKKQNFMLKKRIFQFPDIIYNSVFKIETNKKFGLEPKFPLEYKNIIITFAFEDAIYIKKFSVLSLL